MAKLINWRQEGSSEDEEAVEWDMGQAADRKNAMVAKRGPARTDDEPK